MPRPGITLEDVKAVYVRLQQQGTRPTVSLIRDQLGRGSITTIHGYLSTLREQEGESPLDALLPAELHKPLQQFLRKHAEQIRVGAEAELAESRSEMTALVSENRAIQAERDGAQEDLAEANRQLALVQAERDRLHTANETLTQQLAEVRQSAEADRLAAAKATARLEARDQELKRALERIQELESELANEREARHAADQARALVETAQAVADQRLADQQVQVNQLKEDNGRLREEQAHLRDSQRDEVQKVRAEVGEQIALCRQLLKVMNQQKNAVSPETTTTPPAREILSRKSSSAPSGEAASGSTHPATSKASKTPTDTQPPTSQSQGRKGSRSSKSNRKPPPQGDTSQSVRRPVRQRTEPVYTPAK
ncbi:hypothetical protein D5125_02865 [Magnetovirga frankeli]|uniref:DNA-binding protein n=1 Tax=Magnetovirga frankeli TaxID=947516 RepID=UPI001293F94A|nr:hypothetical protein D5125_02865 [gamma proteobacterium SS-5]